MDFDFTTSEVLVEEIQTDLVRYIGQMQQRARFALARNNDHFHFYGARIDAEKFCHFADRFMLALQKTWHEAMMAATASFVFDELAGCKKNVFEAVSARQKSAK